MKINKNVDNEWNYKGPVYIVEASTVSAWGPLPLIAETSAGSVIHISNFKLKFFIDTHISSYVWDRT